MSYSYSGSASDHYDLRFELPASRNVDPFTSSAPTSDYAIDLALRSVPLPSGLMTRLGRLAYTMTDEAADQVDYLGC
jgi:hypothetical protein